VQRRSSRAGVKTIGLLAVLSVGAGLLSAAATLPVLGAAGVAISDVSKTFNDLPVAGLGQVPSKSELLDTSGHVIATYYPRDIFRDPVPWHQIAPMMRNAIVAIEDYRFWQHGAFDLHGTLRALTATFSGGDVQGGSDIAQQYVKNACVLTAMTSAAQQDCSAHSVIRKLRELRIAINVMHEMTRPQLLVAYLNAAFFGNQAYGIKVASEVYFQVPPSQLTLDQAALLAGVINSPTYDDPIHQPQHALARRAEVLDAMAQHGYISQATANRAARQPLGLHPSVAPVNTGCTAAGQAGFFCDYVMHVMAKDPAYATAYHELMTVGGLKIYTTMNPQDENAASAAVNYVLPANSSYANPNHDVDTEVMIQPGTGRVRAIAVDRPFGYQASLGQDSIDYAVNSPYNGGAGVQTGSSSKVFTLVTALKEGLTYNFSLKVHNGMYVGGFRNCAGQFLNPFQVHNADGGEGGDIPLYFGTVASINAYFVALESRVGLCNVVKTAMSMGLTRADGSSLLSWVGKPNRRGSLPPADDLASFTLGSVNVSPMSMADAYATIAARGVYCHPIAIRMITDASGKQLPIESAGCHRVLSSGVADAANYVLEGVLTNPSATAYGRGIGRPAAAKTGTANGGYYAAFAGYTPTLVGYVSVFNPQYPTGRYAMLGCPQSTYRAYPGGYVTCPYQMFGDMAPGSTWEYSFLRAALGPPLHFVYPPAFYGPGSGQSVIAPPAKKKKKGGKGPGHH
jgi:membrane peptidoglycan carboxypeptidase